MAAARMQRWALVLAGYQYQIVYIPSKENASADMLSRLPVDAPSTASADEVFEVHMMTG